MGWTWSHPGPPWWKPCTLFFFLPTFFFFSSLKNPSGRGQETKEKVRVPSPHKKFVLIRILISFAGTKIAFFRGGNKSQLFFFLVFFFKCHLMKEEIEGILNIPLRF